MAQFEAKPSKLPESAARRPSPPPQRMASMAVPQKIPNAVRKVRVLLRARVAPISRQLSMSKTESFIAYRLFVTECLDGFHFKGA